MNGVSVWDWVVIGEASVAFAGLVYFVLRYALSSEGDWRKTAAGRHMMAFRGSLAAVMCMIGIHNMVAEYPGRDAVRVVLFGVFALAVLQGDRLLEREQARRHAALRRKREQESGAQSGDQRRP